MLRPLAFFGVKKAMVDVIINKRTLGTGDGIFNSLKLLRQVDTRPLFLNHADDTAQVTRRPIEALDDRGVTGVSVVSHTPM